MLEDFLHRISRKWLSMAGIGLEVHMLGISCTVWWEWWGIIGNGQEWLRIVVNDPVIDDNLVGMFEFLR